MLGCVINRRLDSRSVTYKFKLRRVCFSSGLHVTLQPIVLHLHLLNVDGFRKARCPIKPLFPTDAPLFGPETTWSQSPSSISFLLLWHLQMNLPLKKTMEEHKDLILRIA